MLDVSPKNTKIVFITQCDEEEDLVVFNWGDYDDDRFLDSEDKIDRFKSTSKYSVYWGWASFDQFDKTPGRGNVFRVNKKHVKNTKHSQVGSDVKFFHSKKEEEAYHNWHYKNENEE